MTSRRSFLKAAATAPLAAKAVADEAIARATNLYPTIGTGGRSSIGPAISEIGPSGIETPATANDWKAKIRRYLAQETMPEWIEEEIRRRNQRVGYLDADIASKRSWSMSVKILTQRERNIKRGLESLKTRPQYEMMHHLYEKEFGVWI